jgi:hypothetical protein
LQRTFLCQPDSFTLCRRCACTVWIRLLDTWSLWHGIQVWSTQSSHCLVQVCMARQHFTCSKKNILCWEWEYIRNHNGLLSRLNFVFYHHFLLLNIELLQRNCRVLWVMRQYFLKLRENVWSCVHCVSSPDNLPCHLSARRDQAVWWRQYTGSIFIGTCNLDSCFCGIILD